MIEEGTQYLPLDTVTASPEQGSSDSSPRRTGELGGGSPRDGGGSTSGYTHLATLQPATGVSDQDSRVVQEHYQDQDGRVVQEHYQGQEHGMEHGTLTAMTAHNSYQIDGVGGSPPQGNMSR